MVVLRARKVRRGENIAGDRATSCTWQKRSTSVAIPMETKFSALSLKRQPSDFPAQFSVTAQVASTPHSMRVSDPLPSHRLSASGSKITPPSSIPGWGSAARAMSRGSTTADRPIDGATMVASPCLRGEIRGGPHGEMKRALCGPERERSLWKDRRRCRDRTGDPPI